MTDSDFTAQDRRPACMPTVKEVAAPPMCSLLGGPPPHGQGPHGSATQQAVMADKEHENLEESSCLPRPARLNGVDRTGRKTLQLQSLQSSGERRGAFAENVIDRLARLIVEAHDRTNDTT